MNNARRVWFLGAVFLAALVGVASFGFRSDAGSKLRKYKAKLIADGERLTYLELTGGRAVDGTDRLRILTNAMLALDVVPLSPGNLEVMPLSGPGRAVVSWKTSRPEWSNKLRAPSWSELAINMDEAEPMLRDLRVILKEPPADAGPPSGVLGAKRSDFVTIRQSAQWLSCAAICELHEGHLEEALADIDALCQLVQLNRLEYTLVAQMIRVAIGGLGISVTWEALQAPGWTEPQLEHLQRTWEKLDFLQALETGFLGERAGGAEVFALMRSPKARSLELLLNPRGNGRLPLETRAANAFSDYVWLPFYKVTSIDSDEMFYLNAMQESLSATRLLKQGRTWGEVKHISDSGLAELNATASRRINLRLYISAIAIPNFSGATQTAIRREVERRMAVTAIALERFKLRDGRYPDALEKLKPDFLSAIPMDSMSGKPLAYRLKDDGGLLLYSVGEDGIDNGGDGSWVSGAKTSLFDARDAVWPAAAQSE